MIKALLETKLYEDVNAPRKKYNIESIKPSSLGYKCLRKLYYEYFKIDTDTPVSLDSAKNFLQGNKVHEAIQEVLSKTAQFVMWVDPKTKEKKHEFVLKLPEIGVKYSKIDGVIKKDQDIWLLEIKTMKDDKFQTLVCPKDEHLAQGTFYHFGFEEAFKKGDYAHISELKGWNGEVKGVIYFYVNKNTFDFKEFGKSRDVELFRSLVEKCMLVMEYGALKKLPPKTAHFCPWCDYQKRCKKNENI